MSKILCIGRQYGSLGHVIAREFAKETGIAYYDKRIFSDATLVSGIDKEILKKADERVANPLLQPIYYQGNSKEYYGKNANDILFEVQKKIIMELADKGDCVIVGRCADFILKQNSNYLVKSIFFAASMDYRIANIMKIDGLSEKEAAATIRKIDKARNSYYNYYTGNEWGKPSDYDYCINTAIDKTDIKKVLANIYS